jgi:type VI secretion system protein ImpK
MSGLPMPLPDPALPPASPRTLLAEGFHLLALVRDGATPRRPEDFPAQVEDLLARFARQGAEQGLDPAASLDAQYAFCALMDEVILASDSPVRPAWERVPLQLRHFGEHLAGEGFFRRLQALRRDLPGQVGVLEVYHFCLLLGFRGKYRLEEEPQRRLLIREVGQEIQEARGGPGGFAPHWKPPLPAGPEPWPLPAPWAFATLLTLAGAALFLAASCSLRSQGRALERMAPMPPLLPGGS